MSTDAPIRVLHVFPSFEIGGSQARTTRLIDRLGEGFEHAVLSLSGNTDARERIARPDRVSWPQAPPKAGSRATAGQLRELLANHAPDVLCTYNWGSVDALFARRRLASPARPGALHHEDGFGADEVSGPKLRRSLARRFLLRGAHGVVVPSTLLQGLARRSWGVPDRRLHLVPNGVDAERFAPGEGGPELRAELGIPAAARVIGCVGGLRPEKNLGRALAALEELPEDVHLILVGDGPQRSELERRAAAGKTAGRVHFAGARRDTAPWYRAFDLFLLPSDTEQMPIALVEAMASERAAVSTIVGDVATILPPEQHPYMVPLGALRGGPPGNARDVARALRELLDNPQRAAELGAANRARAVAEFSEERMVQRFSDLYRSAARRRDGS